jgi:hypothetical protein
MSGQTSEAREREPLSGLIERVTFHSPESGFCVLRVKVRGRRDLVTVLGSAGDRLEISASIPTAIALVEAIGGTA